MGVKSTVTLTRTQAEDKYLEAIEELYVRFIRSDARKALSQISNENLEEILEVFNDAKYKEEYGPGAIGFDNYKIKD